MIYTNNHLYSSIQAAKKQLGNNKTEITTNLTKETMWRKYSSHIAQTIVLISN